MKKAVNVYDYKKFNTIALISFIIAILYPIAIILFAWSGTYLSHNDSCINVEFYICTGSIFDKIIEEIHSLLIFIVIFGFIFFVPLTILSLIMSIFFSIRSIINHSDKKENILAYIILALSAIVVYYFVSIIVNLFSIVKKL